MCKNYQEIKAMKENNRQVYLYETSEYGMHLVSEDIYLAILADESIDSISKWYAIKAIGELKEDKYIPVLIEVLKKQNESVGETSLHLIAARSLGKIGSAAVPFVTSLLNSDCSTETQIAAADTLGEIGSIDGIPALIEIVKSKPNNIAVWACLSLSKIGIPTVNEQIRIFDSLPDEKKLIVMDSLMRIADNTALEFVAEQFLQNERFYNTFKNSQIGVFANSMNALKDTNPMMYRKLEEKNNG